jgi:hypothetical protein
MSAGVRPEFQERAEQPEASPDLELRDQQIREEAERRFLALVRERDTLKERVAELERGFRLSRRAWVLAKDVIAERFGPVTGNLVRQGIETQVERELGAGIPDSES